jgi:hypothetical protein
VLAATLVVVGAGLTPVADTAAGLHGQSVTLASELPRVMVLLQEETRLAGTEMTAFLQEAGFTVIDPAFARTAVEQERARLALEGDDMAATALGRDLGAHVLILGQVPSEAAPNPADPRLRVATAELSVRALRLDEARLVTTGSASGRGLDATESGAAAEAVRQAMEKLLYESAFLGDVVTDWEVSTWNDEAYWEPGPGSVEAQLGSSGAAVGTGAAAAAAGSSMARALRVAILESQTFPDTLAEGTRGITVVAAPPSRTRIRGVVTDPDAQVTVDGRTAMMERLTSDGWEAMNLDGPAAEFSAEVPVPADGSPVRVVASGESGTYEVDVSPVIGRRWAVLIGISDYADGRVPPLRYADDDARSMYEFLRSPAGGEVPESQIRLLLNEEATSAAIREALFVFLQQAEPEDLVTVYVASHGSPDPARPSNLYILPYDTDVDALAATAFPMWDVKTALRRQIASERVVVIADACRSAGTLVDEANPMGAAFSEFFSPSRRMTLSAAGLNEVSYEDDRWGGGHGVFTYHLLEGLKGAADGNGDGVVSFREVAQYVSDRVGEDTDGGQNPEWSGLGDVEMARVLAPAEDR